MTQTATISTEQPPSAITGADVSINPSDVLLNLIVVFLVPMFLGASAGDVGFARMAAAETVNTYRARNHLDLVSVAQIIAFGLTALGSLSLSMADNLSLSMTLRLRGNAVALNRASEQTRRGLDKRRKGEETPHQPATPDECHTAEPRATEHPDYALLEADVAQALQQAAQNQARLKAPQSTPQPTIAPATNPAPSSTNPASTDPASTPASTGTPVTATQRNQTAWATVMAREAAKLTSSIVSLPPAERKDASLRAAALASTASNLLSGIGTTPATAVKINSLTSPTAPAPQR